MGVLDCPNNHHKICKQLPVHQQVCKKKRQSIYMIKRINMNRLLQV